MEKNKDIKFEEAIKSLEDIVGKLEGGKCDLDEALGLFEEGVAIVKLCSAKLDAASQKVKLLTSDGDVDFTSAEE